MRRPRALTAVPLALVALTLAACGGGDDKEDKKATPASEAPLDGGGGGATPPSAPGQLPPEFVQCMADEGFDIQSPADIHSAPPQVLQACFGTLHQGGEVP